MPKKKTEEEIKGFQIGFRIMKIQRERLNIVIARIKSIDKRVTDTEIYQELMSIKEPEFVTNADRVFLWSGRTDTPERDDNSVTFPGEASASAFKKGKKRVG
jgi:hypothetical protein